jgi:hypothetical protein
MSSYEEHAHECKVKLGNEWGEVHRWLDALFIKLGPKHRSARHHRDGVNEVRRQWGPDAARAARLHILADYGTRRVPTASEAQRWSLLGPDHNTKGETFLTDEGSTDDHMGTDSFS